MHFAKNLQDFEMIFVGVEALAGPGPFFVSGLTNRTIDDSANTLGVRF